MTFTLDNIFDGLGLPAAIMPTGVKVVRVPLALPLKPHQEVEVDALFADPNKPYKYYGAEMGVGKTVILIAVVASVLAAHSGGTAVVVVPPSMRTTWQREFARFAPWLKVHVVRGATESLPTADVYVVGDALLYSGFKPEKGKKYEQVQYLSDTAKLLSNNCVCMGVDEAHRFKNKSGRTEALRALAGTVSGYKVEMSGTITPNGRHMELPSQIDILGPDAWTDIGGKGRFFNYFAPKIDEYARGNANGEELHNLMVGSWYRRILRDDIPDLFTLPDGTVIKIYKGREAIALEGAPGKAVEDYLLAEEDLIEYLKGEGRNTRGAERAEAIVKMTTLRILAGKVKVLAAIERAKEILDEIPGGLFIAAEHHPVIDGLMAGLAKYKPVKLTGGMSDKAKQEAIDAFCSGESRVFIGQTTAAGVGLTLHGGGINHRALIVQLPWTPADLTQLEDRLFRIGQIHDVQIEVGLAAIDGCWTIDERLWSMLETKQFNSTTITDGKGEWLLEEATDALLDSYRQ